MGVPKDFFKLNCHTKHAIKFGLNDPGALAVLFLTADDRGREVAIGSPLTGENLVVWISAQGGSVRVLEDRQ